MIERVDLLPDSGNGCEDHHGKALLTITMMREINNTDDTIAAGQKAPLESSDATDFTFMVSAMLAKARKISPF